LEIIAIERVEQILMFFVFIDVYYAFFFLYPVSFVGRAISKKPIELMGDSHTCRFDPERLVCEKFYVVISVVPRPILVDSSSFSLVHSIQNFECFGSYLVETL